MELGPQFRLLFAISDASVRRRIAAESSFTPQTAKLGVPVDYPYPSEFPLSSRALVKAEKIRAARDFDEAKPGLRSNAEIKAALRAYILRVFLSFAEEALRLGRQGVWSVDQVEHHAREFLRVATLEAWFEKGFNRAGRSLGSVTGHWDGAIVPEVQRELEASPEWKRFLDGLIEVAGCQAEVKLGSAEVARGPDGGVAADAGLPPSMRKSRIPSGHSRFTLNTELIHDWLNGEGYGDDELASRLKVSVRAVASLRNNGRCHGRPLVQKLANLMGRDELDLYIT
jgi:hypothetical protein